MGSTDTGSTVLDGFAEIIVSIAKRKHVNKNRKAFDPIAQIVKEGIGQNIL